MNNLHAFSAIIVGAILFSGCLGQQKCEEATKTISGLTKEFNEPVGNWNVYKSNKADNKCGTLSYTSLNVNATHVATAVFTSNGGATKVEGVVTVVPGDTNQYVFVDNASGAITLYHRVHPDVHIDKLKFFCLFTCDAAEEFVDSYTCYTNSDDVKSEVDKSIEGAKTLLPRPPTFKMDVMNEKCPKA